MRVGVLERPAARPDVRPLRRPVARRRPAPAAASASRGPRWRPRLGRLAADLEQRVGDERRVPHRRHAGLAIGLVVLDDEQLVERGARDGAIADGRADSRARRTSSRELAIAGIDRAEPVLAVQPLGDEGDAPSRWRACACAFGKQRLERAAARVDARRKSQPGRFWCGAFAASADVVRRRRNSSSMRDAARIARARLQRLQHQQRHDARCAPSTKSCDRWNGNQRGSSMISTGITGTPRHGISP